MHFFKTAVCAALTCALVIPSSAPLAAQSTPTVSQNFETGRAAPDRLIIKLKKEKDHAGIETSMKRFGGKTRKRIGKKPTFVISIPADQRDKLKQQLSKDRRVASVELDRAWRPTFTANDPFAPQSWHLKTLGAPAAWDTTRGAGLTIAILDTGIDATHPEFNNKIQPGWNTFADSRDVTDALGHGTWVAGVAAAALNNGAGSAGLAGDALIVPIKVTDPDGYGYSSTIADGLAVAVARGAKIANISFDIIGGDAVITDAAQEFFANGGIVFAAAGNDGIEHADTENPYIVSVGATAQDGTVSTFSSSGAYVDMVAPGEDIISASPGGQYVQVTGTSFASPLAAAAAALVWAAHPTLNPFDVVAVMKQTAHNVGAPGADQKSGVGLIDAGAAVGFTTPAPNPAPAPQKQPAEPEPVLAIEPIPTPTPTTSSTPQIPDLPKKLSKPLPLIDTFATSTPETPHLEPPQKIIDVKTDALGRTHEPNLGKSETAHQKNEERKAGKKK